MCEVPTNKDILILYNRSVAQPTRVTLNMNLPEITETGHPVPFGFRIAAKYQSTFTPITLLSTVDSASSIMSAKEVRVCHQRFQQQSQRRRPGAEFGGDGKTFRGPRFLNDDFFLQKFPISRPKFLITFFLVIDLVSRPFLRKKNHYLGGPSP